MPWQFGSANVRPQPGGPATTSIGATVDQPQSEEKFRIGQTPYRLEDARFLTGRGHYLADREAGNAVHAAFVRSPHGHARVTKVDLRAALNLPGTVAAVGAAEVEAEGLKGIPPVMVANPHNGEPFRYDLHPLLAGDSVRYVGQPVAMVVAGTAAGALDAMEAVEVEFAPLPAVVDLRDAIASGAPQLSAQIPGNLCLDFDLGDPRAADQAIESAAHVVHMDTVNHRIVMNSMETRGAIADYDAVNEDYTLQVSTQNVHVLSNLAAFSLGVAHDKVRFVAPDVGGGFGNRNFAYPEYPLLLWAARLTGRSVRWIASRSDVLAADHQARGFEASATLALDADGRFLALRVESLADIGAYAVGSSIAVQTGQYTTAPGGLYDIPTVHLHIAAALTNTVPIGVTRGPGFAETINVIERLVDKAARNTGIDRMELRRRNLAAPAQMPWTNAVGTTVDSGDFPACLETALISADVAGFELRRETARAEGKLLGIGVACHVKATGGLPDENISLRFKPDKVIFTSGTMAIGQGHETTFRQILGSLLGLAPHQIEYRAGDSGLIAMGGGHGSSRATYMAGTAMAQATEEIAALGARFLAGEAGVDPAAIRFEAGHFQIAESNQSEPLLEVAARAAAAGKSLDTYKYIVRDAMTFPNGCHVAEVEIDEETGQTRLLRYTAVDDYGNQINPLVVKGQMAGAIAQGVGQGLLEETVMEKRSAQLLSGSLMDYALPRADELPSFELQTISQACTTNPLGVKGCGEAGAVAGFPAIGNAIADALTEFGEIVLDGPASPGRVWAFINEAKKNR